MIGRKDREHAIGVLGPDALGGEADGHGGISPLGLHQHAAGGKTRRRAQRPCVVGAAHHPDAIAGGEPTRPRQCRGQQTLAVDHLQERLGVTLARRRPKALAGAAIAATPTRSLAVLTKKAPVSEGLLQ